MKHSRTILLLAAAVAGAFASACSRIPVHLAARQPAPAYAPTNYTADAAIPAAIRRVVLLPVDGDGHTTPEFARELDAIMLDALQKQGRFEVVALPRAECHRLFGAESFDSTAALPTGFVATVGKRYAADAVLFVDVTGYRYMRPLMLGLRAKLAKVDDSGIMWAFDDVVDASKPGVAAAVEAAYTNPKERVSTGEAALLSPSRFSAFAANSMFSTLPGR